VELTFAVDPQVLDLMRGMKGMKMGPGPAQ